MIGERDQVVLRDLARVAGQEGIAFFVIGGGARLLVHDWPLGLTRGRGTRDWDIAVQVTSWAEFERLKQALVSDAGRFSTTSAEHRVRHEQGLYVDVVPFGGVETADRRLIYPRGETSHSVMGLSECAAFCVAVPIGSGVVVRVVSTAGLIVLKAQAYLERRSGITHDVQDIDFVARTYAGNLKEDAILERAGDALQQRRIVYEDLSAYLLGQDVGALDLPAPLLRPLRRLLMELMDPATQAVDDVVRRSLLLDPDQRAGVVRRYAAFLAGLGA